MYSIQHYVINQWLAAGRWFSPGTPVFSTNKTDRNDITEILLEVALNNINQTNQVVLRVSMFASLHDFPIWFSFVSHKFPSVYFLLCRKKPNTYVSYVWKMHYVRAAHLIRFLCCTIMCLNVMNSVLECSLQLPFRLYLQLFVGGLMSYLRYFCLFVYRCAHHILCVFVLFFFVLCTLCC